MVLILTLHKTVEIFTTGNLFPHTPMLVTFGATPNTPLP